MQGCSGDAHGFGNRDLGNLFLQEYADLFLLAVGRRGLGHRLLDHDRGLHRVIRRPAFDLKRALRFSSLR